MKEGWKYKRLGDIATFISGYTPSKDLLSDSGDIPYYKVSDMNTFGNELLLHITSLYLSSTKKIIPKGSVVFPKNGGAIFTNKKRVLVFDSVVDLNTEAIYPNFDYITTDFLYKLLLHIDLGQFDNGGGLPSINIKKMQSYEVPLPPLPEQERIVTLLDAEFAKIDAIKANAEKQLQDAKALFQSALKDMLTPKEGWKFLPFDKSINKTKKTLSIKSKNYRDKGRFPVVSQESSLISGYFDDEHLLFQHENPIVIFGDHTKNIKFIDFDFIVGADGVHILSPIDDIEPKFFYYYLCSIKLRDLGYARHYKLLKQCVVTYPSHAEQERIVTLLDAFNEKIQSLQSNFDTTVTLCNDLKQSILKDIFG